MILPATYLSALLLLVVSMICWGSWANTFKLTGEKWRFEFFSYDFAIGLLLGAVIAAFTFGTLGSELTFSDRLMIAGKKDGTVRLHRRSRFHAGQHASHGRHLAGRLGRCLSHWNRAGADHRRGFELHHQSAGKPHSALRRRGPGGGSHSA